MILCFLSCRRRRISSLPPPIDGRRHFSPLFNSFRRRDPEIFHRDRCRLGREARNGLSISSPFCGLQKFDAFFRLTSCFSFKPAWVPFLSSSFFVVKAIDFLFFPESGPVAIFLFPPPLNKRGFKCSLTRRMASPLVVPLADNFHLLRPCPFSNGLTGSPEGEFLFPPGLIFFFFRICSC